MANQSATIHQIQPNQIAVGDIPFNLRGAMVDVSREEIDAKLAAAEARTETRIAQLSGSIDMRFVGLDHKIDVANTKVDALVAAVNASVTEMRDSVRDMKADNKSLRTTTITTGIASAVTIAGILLALWVAGVNVQNNLIAAFQTGLGIRTLPVPSQPHQDE